MEQLSFVFFGAALIVCQYGLYHARKQLTVDQKAILFDGQSSLWRFSIFIFILLGCLMSINYLPLPLFISLPMILAILLLTRMLISATSYQQLKALAFPKTYLRSAVVYTLLINLIIIGLIVALFYPFANISQPASLYWNGYWDTACSKCWADPQSPRNNHCSSSDCVLPGYYRCELQNPPMTKFNDPRLFDLIKSGQCHYVKSALPRSFTH